VNILVVYYSTYGHIFRLAEAEVAGARSVDGADVRLVRVPELVPEEIFRQNPPMQEGRELQREVPLAQLSDLEWADGIAFGSPTRYGNMAAQMKNFLDQTGPLWVKGALEGKAATCFTSTSTMHGGQETTIVTMWIPLIHLGMLVFGVPYSEPEINTTDKGGSPYGASTVAGQGAGPAQPPEIDLTIARKQGKRLAEITKRLRG
jgi:NAD(P)H dehydrogenase (quinone)